MDTDRLGSLSSQVADTMTDTAAPAASAAHSGA
jgi:hypothetical protein